MKKEDKKHPLVNYKNLITRRYFLNISTKGIGLLFGAGLLGTSILKATPFASLENKILKNNEYPFKLGVASGDPEEDGFVIWTRLIKDVRLPNGAIPDNPQLVNWEIATDESFSNIVQSGKTNTNPFWAHSVHIEVNGLEPSSYYYYRFKTKSFDSPVGKSKTTPVSNDKLDKLNFAILSCQSYLGGYYTAHEHLAEENLDVVLFLGDYIYEFKGNEGVGGRIHYPHKLLETLEDYRLRYAQYKSDPSLQNIHAAFPWLVTFDDHEVRNNWGGEDDEKSLNRQAAAFKAYYEHMPVRKSAIPNDYHIQIYRKCSYGDLVDFNILDTRQFRSKPACGSNQTENCPDRNDPSRTIFGEQQEEWLFNNLKTSTKRWNILANQVLMAYIDNQQGLGTKVGIDKWDGFVNSRDRLFSTIIENNLKNVVVLTGDSHKNWVNDLKEDFNQPQSRTIATEFGGTSLTSGGNGTKKYGGDIMAENPHIKYASNRRGYVKCTLTPERMQADFRTVEYVDRKGAPISTEASFYVKNNEPGAIRLS
jgi:alkaline phosphatase D